MLKNKMYSNDIHKMPKPYSRKPKKMAKKGARRAGTYAVKPSKPSKHL